MSEEVEQDIAVGKLYLSQRFNDKGKTEYPDLLREAIRDHDDRWLAQQIRQNGLLNETELQHRKTGTITKKVPHDAPETVAEGEFNRFYMRGLCRRAMTEGVKQVEVYRAKEVVSPRSASQALIGKSFDPQVLLEDLRNSIGVDTALGLPAGPNSGLSIQLPHDIR